MTAQTPTDLTQHHSNSAAPGGARTGTAFSESLRATGISRRYGDRRVLTDVSVTVSPGRRLGLIGENGVGKSTLLRILAGAEEVDGGEVTRPVRAGMLWQEVRFDPSATLDELLEAALAEVRAIEAELAAAASALAEGEAGGRYEAALDAAEQADIWSVEARRDEILDGLGLTGIPLSRRLEEVSGGQRSRFALAALLLERPDALLLDEPTNHLDDAAAAFLERQLTGWRGPVIFASHDRAFLDAVATGLLDLDPSAGGLGEQAGGAVRFGGSYTEYLQAKAAERTRWEQRFAAEQDELKALQFALTTTSRAVSHDRPMTDRNKMSYGNLGDRVQDQISRRVRNARGRLEELTENQLRKPPAVLSFAGIPSGFAGVGGGSDASGAGAEEGGLLVQATDARIAGRLDVRRFTIAPQSRILITGHNGAGKSTLLTALAGRLVLDAGTIHRRRGLRIGLLEQDVRFADPAASPRSIYEGTLGERRAESTPLSALGLIAPRDLDRPAGTLSTGQQRRLALALIIAKPPHVFLLDEPTNHLSLSLATELEDALGGYPGAVVVATHDRWLRAAWEGERIEMAFGRIVSAG